jgi:hypothetical protein
VQAPTAFTRSGVVNEAEPGSAGDMVYEDRTMLR